MVKKDKNFAYDISDFTEKAEKLFPNEDIYVGGIDTQLVDEKIIKNFFDEVLAWEVEARKSEDLNNQHGVSDDI